ncbi:PhzF family phenazine biosynthesis protein [Herbiconiux sp. A18JL235]|uniref:PhzF family phenazine biosynthesis protein n=1 Tax=Herbiconiux sp. A18JL235 TaxID=3152363 RepID=A0AB39BKX1_9MICO
MSPQQLVVDVVTVFTDSEGGHGNLLGIVRSPAAAGREQEIARVLGYSETVFVEELLETGAPHAPGAPRERVATVRIFTPAEELPFAGHPSVGVSWWLAAAGTPVTRLAVGAGDVPVRADGDITWIAGRAEWAPEFIWHELADPAEVDRLDPAQFASGKHYAWAWVDEEAGHLRSRMFAPDLGIVEDEATGAAAVRLTTLLGRDLMIDQGAGSRILTRVLGDGLVEVGGRTRPVEPVTITLD